MVFGAMAPVVNALALSRGVVFAPLYYMTLTGLITLLTLRSTRESTTWQPTENTLSGAMTTT